MQHRNDKISEEHCGQNDEPQPCADLVIIQRAESTHEEADGDGHEVGQEAPQLETRQEEQPSLTGPSDCLRTQFLRAIAVTLIRDTAAEKLGRREREGIKR